MLLLWMLLCTLGGLQLSLCQEEIRESSEVDIEVDLPPNGADGGEEEECKDRTAVNRTLLGGLMLKAGIISEDILEEQELSRATYLSFSFLRPVLVNGWSVRGREGGMLGPFAQRRGFVDNYVVTYIDAEGHAQALDDPDTGEDEFTSDGNLAQPETVTKEELNEPVKVKYIRFSPEVWSGIPFMHVKLSFCASDADLTEEMLADEEKPDDDIYVKAEELKNSRSGTDAFKNLVDPIQAARAPSDTRSVHPMSPHCINGIGWRYARKPTPVDQFSARGNPQQAWRAMLGLNYIPYLFPVVGPDTHAHRLLEILFRSRSRVDAIKVAGLGAREGSMWGALTKFSVLFKDAMRGGEWAYYSDADGTPRVFEVPNKTRENAQKVDVFHLPSPLHTDALAIYPHTWSNKPYLAIDLLACYIDPAGQEVDDIKANKKPQEIAVTAHIQNTANESGSIMLSEEVMVKPPSDDDKDDDSKLTDDNTSKDYDDFAAEEDEKSRLKSRVDSAVADKISEKSDIEIRKEIKEKAKQEKEAKKAEKEAEKAEKEAEKPVKDSEKEGEISEDISVELEHGADSRKKDKTRESVDLPASIENSEKADREEVRQAYEKSEHILDTVLERLMEGPAQAQGKSRSNRKGASRQSVDINNAKGGLSETNDVGGHKLRVKEEKSADHKKDVLDIRDPTGGHIRVTGAKGPHDTVSIKEGGQDSKSSLDEQLRFGDEKIRIKEETVDGQTKDMVSIEDKSGQYSVSGGGGEKIHLTEKGNFGKNKGHKKVQAKDRSEGQSENDLSTSVDIKEKSDLSESEIKVSEGKPHKRGKGKVQTSNAADEDHSIAVSIDDKGDESKINIAEEMNSKRARKGSGEDKRGKQKISETYVDSGTEEVMSPDMDQESDNALPGENVEISMQEFIGSSASNRNGAENSESIFIRESVGSSSSDRQSAESSESISIKESIGSSPTDRKGSESISIKESIDSSPSNQKGTESSESISISESVGSSPSDRKGSESISIKESIGSSPSNRKGTQSSESISISESIDSSPSQRKGSESISIKESIGSSPSNRKGAETSESISIRESIGSSPSKTKGSESISIRESIGSSPSKEKGAESSESISIRESLGPSGQQNLQISEKVSSAGEHIEVIESIREGQTEPPPDKMDPMEAKQILKEAAAMEASTEKRKASKTKKKKPVRPKERKGTHISIEESTSFGGKSGGNSRKVKGQKRSARSLNRGPLGYKCQVERSLLERPKRINFSGMNPLHILSNKDNSAILTLIKPSLLYAVLVESPYDKVREGKTVETFVVKYRLKTQTSFGKEAPWLLVKNEDGNRVQVFRPNITKYPDYLPLLVPVFVREVQLIPEVWGGLEPAMVVDLTGC